MKSMRRWFLLGSAAVLFSAAAHGQESYSPEQIKRGAAAFEQNCAPCHGPRMRDPDSAFDLRTFPHDQKGRFLNSVSKGKNSMPPFGDLFKPDEIEALWAYVIAGEKQ
jgi:mono/diheme cytochrome c family protein